MDSHRKPPTRAPLDDPEAGLARPASNIKRKTSKQRREESQARRARTASDGSTFGAFFQHQELLNATKDANINNNNLDGSKGAHAAGGGGMRRRRSSRRSSPTKSPSQGIPHTGSNSPPTANKTGSDLGDVASMAIAGLGDDIDIEGLMSGGPPPPKGRARRMVSGGKKAGTLETILDDSDFHGDAGRRFELPEEKELGIGIRDNNMRLSVNTVDSLRVSEASADLDADVAGMLSSLDRDNSMFFSEQSDADFSALVRGETSTNNSNSRASLLGSQIMDKQSSGSLYSNSATRVGASSLPPMIPPKPNNDTSNQQQQEIASFAAMLHSADYGTVSEAADKAHPLRLDSGPIPVEKEPATKVTDPVAARHKLPYSSTTPKKEEFEDEPLTVEVPDEIDEHHSRLLELLDPTHWLMSGVHFDDHGVPYFDDNAGWSISGFVRYLLFNPISPEFTSLQQFCWAVILGIVMGFYTAFWKEIIEHSVEFMWKDMPEALLEWGVFTELDGSFPLYHYMWICPAFWGGLLSYIFVILPTPIPGQNEWIQNVHTLGVQDSETFFLLFVLSTLGMASGLSLGPELPLVLTAGMIGSWLGLRCKQSVLQARVMNITCASAAVGGFFGFPMAGALFVLEIPHRMGLQYFEALSPATIASIVAVLCNRLVTGNDVTGYYSYPFLTTSLPSEIFSSAIVFGLFGALVGTIYARTVLKLKGLVHDFFHAPHDDHNEEAHEEHEHDDSKTDDTAPYNEKTPLMNGGKVDKIKTKANAPAPLPLHQQLFKSMHKYFCCVIPHEPTRATAAGVVAGAMVGVICMFVPHVMFWGEAQLQTLIDKGRTPLPVFGQEDEPTAALTALGYCLIDPNDSAAVRAGFGMGCSFVITVAKIIVTGLSLGTGIIGGHFWGPLFAGCAASHFLTDFNKLLDAKIGFGGTLAAYPCVTILCTMGSTHVVTFRAHMAIMLILTLTISAFDPEDSTNTGSSGVAGDYSAVFPLLVISVFVALMITRQTVFYKAQRSRVDIMALPEVLCEPGKEGMPMVMDYDEGRSGTYESDMDSYEDDYFSDDDFNPPGEPTGVLNHPFSGQAVAPMDTAKKDIYANTGAKPLAAAPESIRNESSTSVGRREREVSSESIRSRGSSPLPPRPIDKKKTTSGDLPSPGKADVGTFQGLGGLSSARLDELLAQPLEGQGSMKAKHRRIQSAPDVDFGKKYQRQRSAPLKDEKTGTESGRHSRSDSFGSQASGRVMRVATIGQLSVEHPSLMDQARMRSATSVIVESRHVRHPSLPSRIPRERLRQHSRGDSLSSIGAGSTGPPVNVQVAVDKHGLPPAEVERAFASAVNQELVGKNNRTPNGSNRG